MMNGTIIHYNYTPRISAIEGHETGHHRVSINLFPSTPRLTKVQDSIPSKDILQRTDTCSPLTRSLFSGWLPPQAIPFSLDRVTIIISTFIMSISAFMRAISDAKFLLKI